MTRTAHGMQRSHRRNLLRLGTGLVSLLVAVVGIQLGTSVPAAACSAMSPCPDGGSQGSGSDDLQSSGTEQATYTSTTSPTTCQVYGNGNGMGSYCVGPGGLGLKSLRERFGGQSLQKCRYSALPDGIPVPFNARPDEGRYLLMTCLAHINMDTPFGGGTRGLTMTPVFVPWDTDITDRHNPISDFLWDNIMQRSNQLPVPFLVTRPNPVPVVGVPTYFTFRWVDPATGMVRAMGPYAGEPDGGPFLELSSSGLLMRAEATGITVNPNQEDMRPIRCSPETPYRAGAAANEQPEGACAITFKRSSASAEKYTTVPFPDGVEDVYNATVTVQWRITYGQPGDMRELGDGFTMKLRQVIPVQEIQAPNQPPTVIY